jgi:hypothetical protein
MNSSSLCATNQKQYQRRVQNQREAFAREAVLEELVTQEGAMQLPLDLDEGFPKVRVIVARHAAPPPGKKVTVGKQVGEWVYELFMTRLSADGFLVEDALDLYHGRGAFEAVLSDEDSEN